MIWHFFEIWVLVLGAFVIGCLLGAFAYGVIADSRLALVQGAAADQIGDVLDRVKAAIGVGPAWRPQHFRTVERVPPPAPEEAEGDVEDPYLDDEEFEEPQPETETARRIEPRLSERREEPRYVEEREPPRLIERREELPSDDFEEESWAPEPEVRRTPPLELNRPSPAEPRRLPPVEPPYDADEDGEYFGGDPDRIASAGAVAADGLVPKRPPGLASPRGGVPDNLTRIRGIGERNETLLNSLGIYHFSQMASWTPAEMRWIGQYLAFPERIERDDWQGQAMVLATGGDTGFEKSAERRRRRRQQRIRQQMAREVADEVASVLRPPGRDDKDEDEDGG